MVDGYQTQHGEGNETESASNRSLCHRVSMIQMFLCDGKYTVESTFSKHACKKFISACLVEDLRNDGHSLASFVKLKLHDWKN